MYRSSSAMPSVGRRPKRHKTQADPGPVGAMGLTDSLTQSLRQDLYSVLFIGFTTPNDVVSSPMENGVRSLPPEPKRTTVIPAHVAAEALTATTPAGPPIRGLALLPGEVVSLNFTPEDGLVSSRPEEERLLVLTNQRLMAFGQHEGMKETVLMPVEEVKAAAVKAGARSKGMLLQGASMVVGAVIFYVLIAYWLTGRIDGPTVPIIRMDLVAFIVFLAVLSGVGMTAQMYFGKPDGEVAFQGDGVKLSFPFKGESAEEDVFEVVNAAFAARQTMVASVGVRNPGSCFSGLDTD